MDWHFRPIHAGTGRYIAHREGIISQSVACRAFCGFFLRLGLVWSICIVSRHVRPIELILKSWAKKLRYAMLFAPLEVVSEGLASKSVLAELVASSKTSWLWAGEEWYKQWSTIQFDHIFPDALLDLHIWWDAPHKVVLAELRGRGLTRFENYTIQGKIFWPDGSSVEGSQLTRKDEHFS